MAGEFRVDAEEQAELNRQRELKARAAAEAAALANINPDGGYRNYPSNYAETERQAFVKNREYQDEVRAAKQFNRSVGQANQLLGTVIGGVAKVTDTEMALQGVGQVYDATIGQQFRNLTQLMIDRGMDANKAKVLTTATEVGVDMALGSKGTSRAVKSVAKGALNIRPVRVREIPRGQLPPGRVLQLPPGEIGAVGRLPSKSGALTIRGQLNRIERPSPRQTNLLATTSQSLAGLSSDAKFKWNIAFLLARENASPRNTGGIVQLDSGSPLLQELANVTTAEDAVRIQKNYFSRHPLYKGAPGSELDHMAPVGRVTDILIGQKPSTIEEALRIMKEEYGLVFSDDGIMSSLARSAHIMKHSGFATVIDWSSPWAQSIVEKVPKNATAKELVAVLLELQEKSFEMTGRAIQTQNFERFKGLVMDILPENIRKQLGEDFDITGRTASKEDWDLFRFSMKDTNERLREIIRRTGQKIPSQEEALLLNSDRYNPYR